MKKTIPAFLSALLITALLGGGMFLIGKDALGVSSTDYTLVPTQMMHWGTFLSSVFFSVYWLMIVRSKQRMNNQKTYSVTDHPHRQ